VAKRVVTNKRLRSMHSVPEGDSAPCFEHRELVRFMFIEAVFIAAPKRITRPAQHVLSVCFAAVDTSPRAKPQHLSSAV
jgi:hypothetical protein